MKRKENVLQKCGECGEHMYPRKAMFGDGIQIVFLEYCDIREFVFC